MPKHTTGRMPLLPPPPPPPPCPYRAQALRALLKQYVLSYRNAYKMRLSDIAEERSSTAEALERQSFEDELRMVKQGSLSTRYSLYKKRVVSSDAFDSYRELEPRKQERTHLSPEEESVVPRWRRKVVAWWLRVVCRRKGVAVDVW